MTISDKQLIEAARTNFTIFKMLVDDTYQHADHFKIIDKELEDCFLYLASNGEKGNNRLGIAVPPRMGKTTTASILFAAYVLGRLPNTKILLASYSKELSTINSQAAKRLVESEIYQQIFPHVKIAKDSKAKDKWGLANPYYGTLTAISKLGSTTGRTAHLVICDDLVSGPKDITTQNMRDRDWDWFSVELLTRLDPKNGVLVTIGTRFAEDDIQGRLFSDPRNKIKLIIIPAYAEENDVLGRKEGERLWPDRFSEEYYLERENALGPYQWAAVYQQRPQAKQGNWFSRDWFKVLAPNLIPIEAERVRAWDKAVSTTPGSCWTAGILLCRTKDGRWIIEDVVRKRLGSYEREQLILETAQRDHANYGMNVKIWIEREAGSSGVDSANYTIANLAGYPVYSEKPTVNKDERLQPVAAQAQGGNFYIKEAPIWNDIFLEEALAVPYGKYRDQMDALALAFSKLFKPLGQPAKRYAISGLYGETPRRKY